MPKDTQGQGGRPHLRNGQLASLAQKLENRGLLCRLLVYAPEGSGDELIEEIVISNPAATERGNVRLGDDGGVTWEYFGKLDDASSRQLLDDITNMLRARGIPPGQAGQSGSLST